VIARAMDRHRLAWLTLIVGHALLAFYFVDLRLTANPLSRALPVVAVYEDGNLHIDRWEALTVDKAKIGEHFYSDKPPLSTAITAVAYGAVRPFLYLPANPSYRAYRETRAVLALGGLLCGALPFLLLVLLCVEGARQLPRDRAAWLAPLALYGGFLHVYAGVFMAHLLGALFVVLAYRTLFENHRPFRAGWLLGLAFLAEYPLALALPLWAVQRYAQRRSASEMAALGTGFLPAITAAAVHNAYLTGDPLSFPYKFNATEQFAALETAYGLAAPSLASVLGLTVSPFRGVFFYAPVVLVLFGAIVRADLRGGASGLLRDGSAAFFLLSLLFYVSRANEPWPLWTGGYCYGPRYLIPAAALVLYRGLQTIGRSDRVATILVVIASLLGLASGWAATVTTGYLAGTELEANPLFEKILPHLLDRGPDLRTAVLASISSLPASAANVLWLALLGATLWLPARLFRTAAPRPGAAPTLRAAES
jgi:hypothetical protein